MNTKKTEKIKPLNLPAYGVIGHFRAIRILAFTLLAAVCALPVILALVPWQQNVSGTGKISALDPLQRIRIIPAPVSGRLVQLSVQEGSQVKKGDVLAKIEDLDKGYSERLEQQLSFVRQELESAHSALESIDSHLIQLQDEREFSVQSATAQLQVAVEKVRAERATLVGLNADLLQKERDFHRKSRLYKGGAKSELDFQKAESAYKLSKSKVSASHAKIEESLNLQLSKAAGIKKIEAEKQAKIAKLRVDRKAYEQKLQQVRKKVTEAETKVHRQSTQTVVAPCDGSILHIFGARTNLISRGQNLIEMVPETDQFAVEFLVRGLDAPLVSEGRKVRLQFEGWPVIQIAGWPSVAMGTFGGIVYRCDAQARADGRIRVIITPDPDDTPWPEQPFLRQGVRVSGFIQLDNVSVGYEIWRQLNAFPVSIETKPKEADYSKMPYQKENKSKESSK